MILIFSIENDPTTTAVIRWLEQIASEPVLRLNSRGKNGFAPTPLSLDLDKFVLSLDEVAVEMADVTSVWYRKGNFWFDGMYPDVEVEGHPSLSESLNAKAKKEDSRMREYFHYLISKQARVLGSPCSADLNKLVTLDLAREVGLKVPAFLVSNQRNAFEGWLATGAHLITKPVSDGLYLWDLERAHKGYFSFTEQLTESMLSGYPDIFPASFAQEEILKSYEVRTFFLDGQTYSMAIFSQSDDQTRTDYRKYNYSRPNRNVPFKLPSDINAKLCGLFKRIGLNTGSADLMVDSNGQFYFLEINPTGQFAALSEICNYHIEREIAHWLTGRPSSERTVSHEA